MMPELANITITSHGEKLDELPSYSGVYRFFSSEDTLLYVGKSVDIKARIYSHFQEGRKPGRHQRIMSQVARIEAQATAGEIGALLVENAAIKAETPLYNRRQRQVRKLWTIHLTRSKENFLQPTSADFSPWGERAQDSYGLFHNRRHVDNTIRRHASDHGLCLRMLGLDKGKGPCFQYQLKRCDGACAGDESADEHNARLLSVLDRDRIAAWPFPGPLFLVERNIRPLPDQPEAQFHLVNHWSWLGCFDNPATAQAASQEQPQTVFDRDAYRMLISALRKGKLELLDAGSLSPVDNPILAAAFD
ncbi:MAG: nucleotide excision repair endonuclease [Proteobacteria bacterium]|nr:MAG: nucleotide excision repair endonuclease [Pseudomonadota bacterium]